MAAAAVASSSTSVQSLKCLSLKIWPNDHHQIKIPYTRILRYASVSCFLGNESNQPVAKWRIPRLAAAVAQEEAAVAAPVEYNGRTLRINFSDKPKPKEPLYPETEHKLFVGNLSWSVTSEILTQEFQEYGKVVGARVLYDGETGRSRGYGFACYDTKAEMRPRFNLSMKWNSKGALYELAWHKGRNSEKGDLYICEGSEFPKKKER
ncbi:uncharacterized protein LOC142519559 [Primulina tabacum]|uniref:uncharacterized protein LOC142519559 n=1 Tax=Primulina tabacum TaxID=48773 RepID=UPI003F595CB4